MKNSDLKRFYASDNSNNDEGFARLDANGRVDAPVASNKINTGNTANGKIMAADGQGGVKFVDDSGTVVVANPTLAGTEANLTGLDVGGTKYAVPQGTTVEANPADSGSTTLAKLKVADTIYNIPAGGSGSFREDGFTLQQIDMGVYTGGFDMYVLGNYNGTYGWHKATAETGTTYIDGVDTGVHAFTMTNVLLVFVKSLGGNDFNSETGTLYNCMGTATTLESATNQLLVLGTDVTFKFID